MKTTWYNHLYVGEKAEKKRYHIIKSIRKSAHFTGAYVITPAVNGNNLFDIYPVWMLSTPFYKDREFFIVGIAADYWESLALAGKIVDEMYRKTGGFDVASFLKDDTRIESGRE